MIYATTEQRFALTTRANGSKQTQMFAQRDCLMLSIVTALATNAQVLSVETLESAIRADAIARGQW